MINCVINRTYFYKFSPKKETKISFSVPKNSSKTIKHNDKNIKRKKNLKENYNNKQSYEITNLSIQNTKLNNTMNRSNRNLLISKKNIVKNILGYNSINNESNSKQFSPKIIKNMKLYQKKSLILKKNEKKSLLLLKFRYLEREDDINIFYEDNGLSISKKLNMIFNLNLQNDELDKLGLLITQAINNIINMKIENNSINDFASIINLSELINESRKKKITVKFYGKNYYYFISNNEINEIVEDIYNKVNKFNKYNHKELKKEIKSSIIEIMKNTQTDYQSMQSQ